jgi:hypothetical protein
MNVVCGANMGPMGVIGQGADLLEKLGWDDLAGGVIEARRPRSARGASTSSRRRPATTT